jgi:hypothetical protein
MTGLEGTEGVISFHAGTKLTDNGVVTDGGRVMALTALGATIEEAAGKARAAAERVILKANTSGGTSGWTCWPTCKGFFSRNCELPPLFCGLLRSFFAIR